MQDETLPDKLADTGVSEDAPGSLRTVEELITRFYALYHQPDLVPLDVQKYAFFRGWPLLRIHADTEIGEQDLNESIERVSRFHRDTKLFKDLYDIIKKENRDEDDINNINFFFEDVFSIEEYPIDPFFLQPIYTEIAENKLYDVFAPIVNHIAEMMNDEEFSSLVSAPSVNIEYDRDDNPEVKYKDCSYLDFLLSMCEELGKYDQNKMDANDVDSYLKTVKTNLTWLKNSTGISVDMLFSRRDSDEDDMTYNFVDQVLIKLVEDFDAEEIAAKGIGVGQAMLAITKVLAAVHEVGGKEALGDKEVYNTLSDEDFYSQKFIGAANVLGKATGKPILGAYITDMFSDLEIEVGDEYISPIVNQPKAS